jgi:hypothetical protein
MVIAAGLVAERLRLVLGLLFVVIVSCIVQVFHFASAMYRTAGALLSLFGAIKPIEDFYNSIADGLTTIADEAEIAAADMAVGWQTGFSDMLASADTGFADMASAAETGFGDMGGAADGWTTEQDSLMRASEEAMGAMEMKGLDYSEYTNAQSATVDLGDAYTDMFERMNLGMTDTVDDTGIFVDDTEDLWRDLRTDVADTLVPDMMTDIENTITETMGDTATSLGEDTDNMVTSFGDVQSQVEEMEGVLRAVKRWTDANEIVVRVRVSGGIDELDGLVGHSPSPLAIGTKLFNEQLRETARLIQSMSGSRIAIPAMAGVGGGGEGPTIVTFNEPIVGQMIVPNLQVGKQMVAELSTQIGERAFGRRMPA